jgi:hypothetical protein
MVPMSSTLDYPIFTVTNIIQDPCIGEQWYIEPHLFALVQLGEGCVEIVGSFHHRACDRISLLGEQFNNLTCCMCAQIPRDNDLKIRVCSEERS